jgi:hypothetical protein
MAFLRTTDRRRRTRRHIVAATDVVADKGPHGASVGEVSGGVSPCSCQAQISVRMSVSGGLDGEEASLALRCRPRLGARYVGTR